MASIFKPKYTKPIPPGAQIVTRNGKPQARFQRRGKTVVAPLTEDGTKLLLERRQWHVRYKNADNQWQTVRGYTDYKATEQLAGDLERRAARQQQGWIAPNEHHVRLPLLE